MLYFVISSNKSILSLKIKFRCTPYISSQSDTKCASAYLQMIYFCNSYSRLVETATLVFAH